jgi:hypothetical protein
MCSSCLFRSQGHCAIINIYTSKVKSYALVLSHYLRGFNLRLYPSVFTCYCFRFCGLIWGGIPKYISSNSGIQPPNNFTWYLTVRIENASYYCSYYYFLLPFFLHFIFFFFFLLLLVLIIFVFSQYVQYTACSETQSRSKHKRVCQISLFLYIYIYIYIYIYNILINKTRFVIDYVSMSFAVIWIIGGN